MSNALHPPIVAGVDGSDSALAAVRWAAQEAQRRQTRLRLVHSCEVPAGYRPGFIEVRQLEEALAEEGRATLALAGQQVRTVTPDLEVEAVQVTVGSVAALVRESADAAMLVLGTRGLGGFTGLVVGSTAVEVAGRSQCPVVVVRDPDRTGSVVVGVDGTPVGEGAIAFAFAEASARGVALVAVHTWSDLLLETAFVGDREVLDVSLLAQEAEETLAERLAGWQEKYPDVRVTRHVLRERASKALLRFAEDAELVVVGSRGRGGFLGLLLGSTSQHLLRHAPCPVAIVRTTPAGERNED